MDKKEIKQDEIAERLAGAEGILKNEKIKLPDDVLKRAKEGLRRINEKLEKHLPIYESDFDFMEELEWNIKIIPKYNKAMENLKGGDLYNPENPKRKSILDSFVGKDKKAPTVKEVISALRANLTFDQKEVIAKMKSPVFLIKPITTHKRFLKNLESVNPIPIEEITRKSEWSKNEKDAKITSLITGWEVGFVEGEKELDGKSGNLGELIKEWERGDIAKKGVKLITNNEYMLLMAESIKKGNTIDDGRWTVLRGEGREQIAGKDKSISYGSGTHNLLYFRAAEPRSMCFDVISFRYAVMIKI